MQISAALLERILAHAQRDFPNECCGVVATVELIAVVIENDVLERRNHTDERDVEADPDERQPRHAIVSLSGESWRQLPMPFSHVADL